MLRYLINHSCCQACVYSWHRIPRSGRETKVLTERQRRLTSDLGIPVHRPDAVMLVTPEFLVHAYSATEQRISDCKLICVLLNKVSLIICKCYIVTLRQRGLGTTKRWDRGFESLLRHTCSAPVSLCGRILPQGFTDSSLLLRATQEAPAGA